MKAYTHIYLFNKSKEIDIDFRIQKSLEILEKEFESFINLMKFHNWDISTFELLPTNSWRVEFNI